MSIIVTISYWLYLQLCRDSDTQYPVVSCPGICGRLSTCLECLSQGQGASLDDTSLDRRTYIQPCNWCVKEAKCQQRSSKFGFDSFVLHWRLRRDSSRLMTPSFVSLTESCPWKYLNSLPQDPESRALPMKNSVKLMCGYNGCKTSFVGNRLSLLATCIVTYQVSFVSNVHICILYGYEIPLFQ